MQHRTLSTYQFYITAKKHLSFFSPPPPQFVTRGLQSFSPFAGPSAATLAQELFEGDLGAVKSSLENPVKSTRIVSKSSRPKVI